MRIRNVRVVHVVSGCLLTACGGSSRSIEAKLPGTGVQLQLTAVDGKPATFGESRRLSGTESSITAPTSTGHSVSSRSLSIPFVFTAGRIV
jgi:hypothetical protein